MLNRQLLQMAQFRVWEAATAEKRADAMGGAPPGGAAPQAAPMGMPAGNVGAAAAMMPQSAPPMQAGGAGAGGAGGKPKFDPLMLDFRIYNLQQCVTALMNAQGVKLPPEATIMPPGTNGSPPSETALPGGPMAPTPQAQAQAGGDPSGGAFPPIDPMQGFDPSAAPADGGGAPKTASLLQNLLRAGGKSPTEKLAEAREAVRLAAEKAAADRFDIRDYIEDAPVVGFHFQSPVQSAKTARAIRAARGAVA